MDIHKNAREWAYARAYNTSDERTAELPRWLHRYNWHRPHRSIGSKPPISRLGLAEDNLLRLHNAKIICGRTASKGWTNSAS